MSTAATGVGDLPSVVPENGGGGGGPSPGGIGGSRQATGTLTWRLSQRRCESQGGGAQARGRLNRWARSDPRPRGPSALHAVGTGTCKTEVGTNIGTQPTREEGTA